MVAPDDAEYRPLAALNARRSSGTVVARMGVFDRIALATLPLVPRPIMRRLASRYIAGERLEEALERLEALRERGHPGILDILGEDVRDAEAARRVARNYREAAQALQRARLDAYVSIKPTHIGLRLSEDLATELYADVARDCAEQGRLVRVEMEDHTTTDATLRVFERLRREFDNVGIVLQSRLHRTPRDVEALAPGLLDVRMVKGVYLEPASIAHTDDADICAAYVACSEALLARGARVAFATHDDRLAARCQALCAARGIGPDDCEMQVLLGVREPLWEEWRRAGHQVRVYVPYGPEWRPYSTRRLKRNPQMFRHVLRDVLGRGPR
jgi:proline dehydrogenase